MNCWRIGIEPDVFGFESKEQMGHGGSAHVNGNGKMAQRGIAFFYANGMHALLVAHKGDGDLAVFRAQGFCSVPDDRERVDDLYFPPPLLDGTGKTVEVREAVAQFWSRHLEKPFDSQGIVLPLLGQQLATDKIGLVLV